MNNIVLNTIITALVIPILTSITVYLVSFLKKKALALEAKTNNDTLKKFIDLAENIIETTVTAVSQTFVDDLKKNGTFDKASQAEAFEMAKQKILSTISENVKQTLISLYGDLDQYVDSRIEYYVRKVKTSLPSPKA
ncbi:MAG: hypothetical protein N3B21_13535 [Clostridia bacterium]|nr:hypothetical protein [Clostridia bacterium]